MYHKTKLDNGVRVVTAPLPERHSAALGIWIKVGGRYETEANKGISHFLEHLLFKGSTRYSCRALKESIEGVGGSLNGFTSEEATCYLAKVPLRHLDKALDVLSDMVCHPLLREEDVAKERTVILEELKMYKDHPQSHVWELLDELMWPKQPLGASIIGTIESLHGLTSDTIKRFKEDTYTPPDIVVAAAGSLQHERFLKKVARAVASLNGDSATSCAAAVEEQDAPRISLVDKATEQTHLLLGFHSLRKDHPLKYALSLLHVIVGGNMSSRLFETVREEKGLAYEIGTQVKRFSDTGSFVVHAGIDNGKVMPALELIVRELATIKAGLVTKDELNRAKEFFMGQLLLQFEDAMDQMLWIGETMVGLGKTYSFQTVIKEVAAVTREDIRTVARGLLIDRKACLALIGPQEKKRQDMLDCLHFA